MNKQIRTLLKRISLVGNGLFVAWILFNGMDAGWHAARVQLVSGIGLITLLMLNTYLIVKSK